MNDDRDLDLILALAEGRLSGAERLEFEARLAEDAALAEELALQRIAMEALASPVPVAMSDAERQRLRSAVRAELRLDDAAPAAAADRRPSPRWVRWLAPAMGIAAVFVVGAIVVGGNLGGQDTLERAAATLATEDAGAESAGGADQEQTTTTAAGAEVAPMTTTVPLYGAFAAEDLEEAVATEDVSVLGSPKGSRSVDVSAVADCGYAVPELAEAVELVVRGVADLDGREVTLVGYTLPDGTTGVLVVDLAVCAVVDIADEG